MPDSYTKLLLHLDGADEAQSTTDDGVTGHTITFGGTAQLDTAQSKFGVSSLLLDGNSDYITAPDHADWSFGTGDWTIDFWVRWNGADTDPVVFCSRHKDAQNYFYLYKANGTDSGDFQLHWKVGNVVVCSYKVTWDPTPDQWYHIAIVRHTTSMYFFINGASQTLTVTTAVSTNDLTFTGAVLKFGDYEGSYYLNGWMDEIRVSKGIARWVANFEVPWEAYSDNNPTFTETAEDTGSPGFDHAWIESTDGSSTINANKTRVDVTGAPASWDDDCIEFDINNGEEDCYAYMEMTYTSQLNYFKTEVVFTDISDFSNTEARWFAVGKDTPNGKLCMGFRLYDDNGTFKIQAGVFRDGSSATYYSQIGSAVINTPYILEFMWDAAAETWAWRIDGVPQPNDIDGTDPVESDGALTTGHGDRITRLVFGAYDNSAGAPAFVICQDNLELNDDDYAYIAPTVVTPDVLSLTMAIQTPTISIGTTILPDTLSLALTGHTPTISIDYTHTPNTFTLNLTQHTSVILTGITVLPDTLSLALTQQEITVIGSCTITPDTLLFNVGLLAPTVYDIITVLPDILSLALTSQVPIVMDIITIMPDCFNLELIQAVPLISIDCTVLPAAFTLALLLQTPNPCIGWPTMTADILAALIDPYSGGAWVWLAEIEIPGYSAIRLARNTEDVIYSGNTFLANNFDIGLSALVGDGSIPRIVLRVVQDGDQVLEDQVNASEGACGGTIKIIRAHEDFLAEFIDELEMTVNILNAESDTDYVQFNLGIPNPLLRKIPIRRSTSKICPFAKPGLFKGVECQYAGGDTTCTGKYSDCCTKGNQVHFGAELGLDPNNTRV